MKRLKFLLVAVPLVILMVSAVVLVYQPGEVESSPLTCTRTKISDLEGLNLYVTPNGDNAYYFEEVSSSRVIREYDFLSSTESTISGTGAEPIFEYLVSNLVNNDYVCWLDTRNSSTNTVDLYAYDISSSTEIKVTSSPGDIRDICLVGDYVAYLNYDSGSLGVYVVDLSAALINPICITSSIGTMGAACANIDGGMIGTVEYFCYEWITPSPSPVWDLKLYNTSTQATTTVANTSYNERWPVMQNGVVYYQEVNRYDSLGWSKTAASSNSGSIKAYNIGTSSTSTVDTYGADDWIFLVPNTDDANKLIYIERDGTTGYFALKAYTYGGSTTTICTASSGDSIEAFANSSYSNKVVYSVGQRDDFDTYVYDLSTSTTSTVCDNGNSTMIARIAGNKYIWAELTYPDEDIIWDNTLEKYVFDNNGALTYEIYYNTY